MALKNELAPWADLLGLNDDVMISEQQLAVFLGLCRATVARHRKMRTGPPHLAIGRKILYRGTTLKKWVLSHEVTPLETRRARPSDAPRDLRKPRINNRPPA